MILRATLLFLAVSLLGTAATAKAPSNSPFPVLRPGGITQIIAMALKAEVAPDERTVDGARPSPRPRQQGVARGSMAVALGKPARVVLATAGTAVLRSPRPDIRPQNLKREFIVRASGMRQQPIAPTVTGRRGSLCGDPAIEGQKLSPIAGRLRGCGIPEPVRVTAVDGVTLSQPATLTCGAAKALRTWVSGTVKPTVGRLGGGVASLKVAAHYSCRTRNNKKGAKISEHGRGRAIDISAIVLKNGVALTVLKGWHDRAQAKVMRALHKNACGTFGTVLGPNADRYHQDHFHFDVARYRSGTYCR